MAGTLRVYRKNPRAIAITATATANERRITRNNGKEKWSRLSGAGWENRLRN